MCFIFTSHEKQKQIKTNTKNTTFNHVTLSSLNCCVLWLNEPLVRFFFSLYKYCHRECFIAFYFVYLVNFRLENVETRLITACNVFSYFLFLPLTFFTAGLVFSMIRTMLYVFIILDVMTAVCVLRKSTWIEKNKWQKRKPNK